MEDPARVGSFQGARQLTRQLDRFARRDPPLGVEAILQRAAGQEFLDEVGPRAVDLGAEHAHEVGVTDLGERARFAAERIASAKA